ncbi:SBBP repeat-containing protein [Chroogloeocystis siderophila]|uniref:SBBP repeat-containing protein n=1 Tax=Chroogloeocystis siderophila TaxID=329163 RepID=UPI0009FE9913|nr:SBBP repeat-containing protein [Chroogloeocystis siderophila]
MLSVRQHRKISATNETLTYSLQQEEIVVNNPNKSTENGLLEALTQKYLPKDDFNTSLQTIIQNQGSNTNNVNIPQVSLNLYTPGSDLAAGFRQNQLIAGRYGNDVLIGLDPVADNSSQLQFDIFLADFEVPGLSPSPARSFANKFFLGDWQQPYYANNGNYDFAVALNFNPSQDVIQLHGTSADYQLVESSLGTAISFQEGNNSDFVAFVPLVSDLNLNGNYFQFVGDTPPEGPVLNKAQQLGTSKFDIASGVSTDGAGNVYLVGGTTGDLGTIPGSDSNIGSRDAWVARYNSDGNLAGIVQFGSSEFDTTYDIATDQEGNAYITGVTQGNLAGPRQGASSDTWVAKYDSQGNQKWIQQYGTDIINTSLAIDIDDDGNVYQAGFTVKAGGVIGYQDDFWVTKYDTNGTHLWFSEFGDPNSFDECYGIAVSSQGNSYLTGWTLGDLTGEGNAGAYDTWVAKYDTNGNQEWIQQFGSSDYEFAWDIAVDSQGNSYATGWTLGDLGGENAGSYDAWIAKYDTNGNQEWIQQFGGSGADEAFAIDIDVNDNIFVTGYTDDVLEGVNKGEKDAWVAKYNTDGDQLWIQQFGTPNTDFAGSIAADNFGSLFVVGNTDGSLGGTNAGSWDGWLAKLNSNSQSGGALQDFTAPGNSAALA